LLLVRRWHPEREIVADGTYSSLKLLDRCRRLKKADHLHHSLTARCCPLRTGPAATSRSDRTASLEKGGRLPNLSVVAEDPNTDWTPIMVDEWYGREKRTVEAVSATAVWHSTGLLPAVPLRWVLIRDPRGKFATQALLCTDFHADPERIISWFVRRWQMEATFREVRQRLGFETQRHWSERAIPGGPLPRCWLCSPWLLCSLTSGWRKARASFAKRAGTTRGIRPSRMPWRW